jgi:hypothetical protein
LKQRIRDGLNGGFREFFGVAPTVWNRRRLRQFADYARVVRREA